MVVAKSELGEPKLRIERSGNFRTAIRMNSELRLIESIKVYCFSYSGGSCNDVEILEVSSLSRNFKPLTLRMRSTSKKNLKPDESLVVAIDQKTK